MSDVSTHSLTARLGPNSGTAELLRIVSILHSRCTTVSQLTFDTEHAAGAMVTAQVILSDARWSTLQESLLRPVEVLEVIADGDTM